MSLKNLLTDLTTGVNAYPNHNTPSTAGGFNYGNSYTPIFEGVFRQKTFEFGKGRTSDRPGGAFSNEPYLYSGLLAASQLPDVPDPGGSVSVGDFVDSATDGLIRGGLLTAIKRSAQDVLRLGKWAYDGPGGPAWLLTQTGLQRSNPKTEEEQISFLGINLGGRSRAYNPLGINTLAQAFTSFSGLHINRAGLLPTSYGIKIGYNVDSTEDTKYEYQVKNNADKISDLENEVESFYLSSNRMLSLYDKVLNKGSETLYSYSGGPHSIYGIGSTTIKRYNFTRGEYSKLFYLKGSKNASKYYQAGIDDQYYTPYQVKYEEGWSNKEFKGYLYDSHEIRSNIKDEPGLSQTKDRTGKKLIYKNSDFDVDLAYQVNSKNITDFRQNLGRGYTNYQEKTGAGGDGVKYIREERVNLGNPGIRLNRAVDKLGRLDYAVYSPESIDKINALDIIRTKGDFTDQRYRDLIRFRIEAVDSDKPDEADSMIFRAFLDDFSDSYNASHNSFKYNGRGEEFYTYNMFSRKISFSFKIAAQSRHEMMPLYRKLNFLVSNVAPEYKVTRMRTPFIRLTIGSMIDRVPGILNSVSLKWDKNYPWEIALDGPEKTKRDILVLPHVLDVSVSFTPVHNFLPQKSISESPFILSHTNNRSLHEGEQWYKAGAAQTLDEANIEGLRKRMGLDKLTPFSEIIPDQSSNTQTTDDILKGDKEKETAPAGAQSEGTGGAEGGQQAVGTEGGTAEGGTAEGGTSEAASTQAAQNPIPKTATQGDSETTNNTTIPPSTTTTTEPEKIPIIYKYVYDDYPDTNSAIVGISNNVNLPWIEKGYGNVKAQGGKEGILKDVAFKFDNHGESVAGIYFPKTGTPTAKVEGPVTFVEEGL
jgi:hypothetical protein